jgi:hypothetical protein
MQKNMLWKWQLSNLVQKNVQYCFIDLVGNANGSKRRNEFEIYKQNLLQLEIIYNYTTMNLYSKRILGMD